MNTLPAGIIDYPTFGMADTEAIDLTNTVSFRAIGDVYSPRHAKDSAPLTGFKRRISKRVFRFNTREILITAGKVAIISGMAILATGLGYAMALAMNGHVPL